jgi:hypothetical protein
MEFWALRIEEELSANDQLTRDAVSAAGLTKGANE